MRPLAALVVLNVCGCVAQDLPAPAGPSKAILVPADTKILVALIGAVRTRSARAGDVVRCETTFPVAVNEQMAIPPGTYLQGVIDILVPPGRLNSRAEMRLHFTQIVFGNGYTVPLPDQNDATAVASLTDMVAARSDVLLDNGTQFEVLLTHPLELDSARVAAALARSKAPDVAQWKTASQCRTIPATPGTPDTYVPGTPATPPTIIPGGPGMPDVVIPGNPGTPATVIPGSQGSPEIPCPAAPLVRSKPVAHRESFSIAQPVLMRTGQLPAAHYEVIWEGLGPAVRANILRGGKSVAEADATVVPATPPPPETQAGFRTNADGSLSLELLQFKGKTYALRFN